MPTKAQLEQELKALERQSAENADKARKLDEIENAGIHVWEANTEKPEACVCISIGGDDLPSINVYHDENGTPVGVTMYDQSELVFAQGLLPAALMLEEVKYARRHG